MSETIKITPEKVRGYASQIRSLNNQLAEILNSSKAQITGLQGSWTGEAAEATISAFNGFANKYFENYQKMIDNYAQFLEQNVAESYAQTQKINAQIGAMI